MCGIAGMAGRSDALLLQSMTDALAHRGPDGEGQYLDATVALGHRRLSIIDIAAGAQPMAYGGGRYHITYNGEVYNYRELREQLEVAGHVFKTHSDTEVLLAAYAQWGEKAVERFQGMFAFALWDGGEGRLFLARDPIGVKPLYYARVGDVLYFASEMKALLLCPGVNRELDRESLDDYLTYLYTVPPRTIFQGIRQLAPGECLRWERGGCTFRRYWQPVSDTSPDLPGEAECLESVNALLADTITCNCIADVPLGAFLSGGLDSAAIVSYMARSGNTPRTFTMGFGDEGARYDETEAARDMAQALGTEHHEITATPDVAAILPDMVRHFDEPFGNPTALLTWLICKHARQHMTVVLSGDGGDEGFGGYPRYVGVGWAERYRRVPATLRARLINPLVQRLPESVSGFHAPRRLREFSAGTLLDPVDMYASWIGYYTREERQALYTPELARELDERDATDYIRGLARSYDGEDPVARAMYIDIQSFLPNNVLQYGDRMSMAHALEVRVPLADAGLLDMLLRTPSSLKFRRGKGKQMLRSILASRLPANAVARRKQGFNPPMGVWLNGPLRDVADEFLSSETTRSAGYFNPVAIQRMRRAHAQGVRDYTWHLWALIVFEQWRRLYL